MKRLGITAAFLVLAACATKPAEPIVRTVEIRVPIAVPCKITVGPDPVYPDTREAILAAPDLFRRVQLIVAGRLMRIAREAEIKTALKGCTG